MDDTPPQEEEPTLYVWPQFEYALAPEYKEPSLSMLMLNRLGGMGGWMASLYVSEPYAEGYVGPAFYFGPLTWGVGLGIESYAPGVRAGLVANLAIDRFSALGYAEVGGSGPWARLEAMMLAEQWLGLGVQAQSDAGVGPRVELHAVIVPLTLYGATLYRWWDHQLVGLVGLKATVY